MCFYKGLTWEFIQEAHPGTLLLQVIGIPFRFMSVVPLFLHAPYKLGILSFMLFSTVMSLFV